MRFYDDPIEISTDVWVRLLNDREITRESDVNYPALKGGASCFMDNTCITEM